LLTLLFSLLIFHWYYWYFHFQPSYWYYAIIDAISPLFLSFIFDFRHIISFRYFHFISPWYCAIIDDIDAMLSCRFRCHFHFSLYFDAAIISLIRWCWLFHILIIAIDIIDISLIDYWYWYWYYYFHFHLLIFSLIRHYAIIFDIISPLFIDDYYWYYAADISAPLIAITLLLLLTADFHYWYYY
jgi:hypothetical protein